MSVGFSPSKMYNSGSGNDVDFDSSLVVSADEVGGGYAAFNAGTMHKTVSTLLGIETIVPSSEAAAPCQLCNPSSNDPWVVTRTRASGELGGKSFVSC